MMILEKVKQAPQVSHVVSTRWPTVTYVTVVITSVTLSYLERKNANLVRNCPIGKLRRNGVVLMSILRNEVV